MTSKMPPMAKMPPKAKTAPKVKTATVVTSKRPPMAADLSEDTEPIQRFEITATERTFLIKFGHQHFGIVKHDTVNRFENLQRNCESVNNKFISEVIGIMKTYLRAGMSFSQLKERLSKNEALFAPTMKVFINRINKE